MKRFDAIVPAYNEQQTIGNIVRVLKKSSNVKEVIVVSDGSSDNTVVEAAKAGAMVVEHEQNQGKGQAMLSGLAHTTSEVVGFFDADLLSLTVEHVEQLAQPVLENQLAMSCSLRDRGPGLTALTKHLPLISGERVMRREVIETIDPKYLRGYMAEVAMNFHCRTRGWAYGAIVLKGLYFRRKYQKVGFFTAVIEYLRMAFQVIMAMVLVRLAHLRGKI